MVTVVVAPGVHTAAQPVGHPSFGAFVTVGVTLGQHFPAQPYVIVEVAGSLRQLQKSVVVVGVGQGMGTWNRSTVTVGQAGSTMVLVMLRSLVVVVVVMVLRGQALGKAGDTVMMG